MKKKIIIVLVVVMVFLLAFYVFNRFDTTESVQHYTEEDLNTATFEKNNGFYRLWTLIEPMDVDVESDEVINKYRRLFDQKFDNAKYLEEWSDNKYKGMYKSTNIHLDMQTIVRQDWCEYVLSHKDDIAKFKSFHGIYQERYRKMIDSEVFEDFTPVRLPVTIIKRVPSLLNPNLLAWLRTARLYIADNILQALEGKWEQSVSNLLHHLHFYRRTISSYRPLITSLIAMANAAMSVEALAALMNHPECPNQVFRQVFDGLPPRQARDFSVGNAYIWERLWGSSLTEKEFYSFRKFNFSQRLLIELTFQPKRTGKYFHELVSKIVEYESTPPYKWSEHAGEFKKHKTGWFWWLQNAGGKIIADRAIKNFANTMTAIWKSYRLKTIYDMAKISAELHLKYNPGLPVEENLKTLETYRTLPDPCSGKPYRWNEKTQVLYSIGTDREDNGGDTKGYSQREETDFALPVVLYVK